MSTVTEDTDTVSYAEPVEGPPSQGRGGLMLCMKKILVFNVFNRPIRQNPGYPTESCS